MDRAQEIVAQVMERVARSEHAPGLAWGLVRGGGLVASGGVGTLRVGDDARPTASSVFRIASMTKSFTGAALMSLVANGDVRLDEPVATYLPAVAGWPAPTTDAPTLTVRHLVSMESGLPTDDAWADRHLDLAQEEMDALIADGPSRVWTPGTIFEYSNLGWGVVGQIIRAVTGEDVQSRISRDVLAPLGMTRTTWARPDHDGIAEPYHWRDGEWHAEPSEPGDGTIAPMGGLWSTVADLARWVSFFLDAWPPRDDPDDGPAPRWARREMQQARRFQSIDRVRPRPDGPSRMASIGYGIGLGVRADERLGSIVGHSGGLPGYGSHMRWMPDRGVGVVALSNVTYGGMSAACIESLERLADADLLPAAREVSPTPTMHAIAERSVALVNGWTDVEAMALFADNVAMDEDLGRRAAKAAAVVERHGPLALERFEADTPTEGDAVAAKGAVRLELALNHESRVQWWELVDRETPSDEPILADPVALGRQPRSAYVVLRPTGDLVDAFDRWRGEVLDRLGGAACVLPSAHATMKPFGSNDAPIAPEDELRIADVVATWASTTPPIALRAETLELWDGDEPVPVLTLARDDAFGAALVDLWQRSAAAGLPVGHADDVGAEGWRPHLSLCYPAAMPPPAVWEPLRAWARYVDIGESSSVALTAELVAFGDGRERRLGRYPFRR
jgi:CubicO group peptidase (beta-lactamase class C family)